MPPKPAAFPLVRLLLLVLAGLVGDAATGLASGLARGLALAAAAVGSAFAQVAGLDGLDVFHGLYLHLFLWFFQIYHTYMNLSIIHIYLPRLQLRRIKVRFQKLFLVTYPHFPIKKASILNHSEN